MSVTAINIVAAIRAGDIETLGAIALELHAALVGMSEDSAALSRHREKSAARKREFRARRDVPGSDVTIRNVPVSLPPSPSSSFPTTLLTTSSPTIFSEQSENAPPETVFENIALALSTQLGDRIGDVRDFLKTRLPHTRTAWMKTMLKIIGPGSPLTVDDLADACNDALALDKPIEGPHALRAFVAKQREERQKARQGVIAGSIGPTHSQTAREARERELRDEETQRGDEKRWIGERYTAIGEWQRANEVEYAVIYGEVRQKILNEIPREQHESNSVGFLVTQAVIAAVSAHIGFPDFDTWRKKVRRA